MTTKFTITAKGMQSAQAQIARLPKEIRGPLRHQLGKDAASEIVERAFKKGLDTRDKQFKWKKKPRERSRLLDKGDLRDSIRYNASAGRVESVGEDGKAHAHQYGLGPAYSKDGRPRKFFGISPANEKSLNVRTKKNTDATIRAWARGANHWRVTGSPTRGTKPLKVTR